MVKNNNQTIHILGIAGTFMANLAVIAKQLGFKVTGADANVYPPMSDLLEQQQIQYVKSYDLDNNKEYLNAADHIVVGNALSRGNPCVEYILDHKKQFKSGPQWLAENLLYEKWVLAVSGTHGKTTTSSMLACVLDENGLNPGFLIGGMARNFIDCARVTDSKYFVIEADEYDTAFFDKRPKFLHYMPNTLIINNIEYDHADIYPNINAIEQQFGYLLRTVPRQNGIAIAPESLYDKLTGDSEITRKYGVSNKHPDFKLNAKFFAIAPSVDDLKKDIYQDKLVAVLKISDGSAFDCYLNNKFLGTVEWNCLGYHNVNNGLAAIIAANSVGIDYADAIKSLAKFKGVARRLEKKAVLDNDIIIFDDFAHHPTAIKTTLDGLRKHYQDYNLTVVVDFSSYSMRSGVFSNADLINSLTSPDSVYLYQAEYVQSDLSDLFNGLKKANTDKNYYLYNNPQDLIQNLVQNTNSKSVIVFMTKGDFNKNIEILVDKLTGSKTNATLNEIAS